MPVKVFFNNSCNICKLEIDHYKKNSDEKNYYSENLNSSKKNDRFSSNSFKNKNVNIITNLNISILKKNLYYKKY